MKTKKLGASELHVPVLSFGAATFGGGTNFFRKWGSTDVSEAKNLVDIALEVGCTLFDTADVYSNGASEEILGAATRGRRDKVLLATKMGMRFGDAPEDIGTSGPRIIRSCEASLRRLGTDHIDLFQLHAFDATASLEEVVATMNLLIESGKIGNYGVSNYSGWHLMKLISIADRCGLKRPVSHQAYYSLADREFEWELMPLALDQDIGTMVWSPLAGAKLTGKVGRHIAPPDGSRAATDASHYSNAERLWTITDTLEAISLQTGYSIPKIALSWLLQRPSISTVIIGARTSEQLRENLGATEVSLSDEHLSALEKASATRPIYPYWHQVATYAEKNPSAVPLTLVP
ncbi:aldo/keto reductase [Herbaspirillum huttiense]|uniref:aldo/keto reductase n=1 Tax=Herbaspirillum huttiense TaxID=863372 RepID=UPI001AEAEE99|nr:aldo/keto reductase [Herbaspirillum huttiense]UWE19269.1 aldo/keto reductase [Herbaspirillum huttiense]